MFVGMQTTSPDQSVAKIGISFELLAEVEQKTRSTICTDASTTSMFVEFTQKMLINVYNYCSSFAKKQSEMTPEPNESFVPLSALQKWYDTFQRRMTIDQNFWKTL